MYEAYFGLTRLPFALTPDPHFFYLGPRHREALALLRYGVAEGAGFAVLTGEVGAGKTTVCRRLLEELPESVDVALLLHPPHDEWELVAAVCDELAVPYPREGRSVKAVVDALNRFLLANHARGRRTALLIDEAQNLPPRVLEQVRLLTNLETATAKLLQVVLVGQPELAAVLARHDLRQLAQRVVARYHLDTLDRAATAAYVRHRLATAGAPATLFDGAALRLLHHLTGGVPRRINVVCDRALLGAYARERKRVDAALLRQAAAEAAGAPQRRSRVPRLATAALLLLAVAAVLRVADPSWQWGWAAVAADRKAAPAAAVPPPAVPAPPVLPALIGAAPKADAAQAEREALLGQLFQRWGVTYAGAAAGNACEQAQRAGLQCVEGRFPWGEVEAYNRPALLELRNRRGPPRTVLLKAFDDNDAVLVIGGEERRFLRAEVAQAARGELLLLWRPPIEHAKLEVGSDGPAVRWLRRKLAELRGEEVAEETLDGTFDDALKEEVMAFQRDQGLKVDGVVGRQTLLYLGGMTGEPGAPRLLSRLPQRP